MELNQEKVENYFQTMDYDKKSVENIENYDEVLEWIKKNKVLKTAHSRDKNTRLLIESPITNEQYPFIFQNYSDSELDSKVKEHDRIFQNFHQHLKQNYNFLFKMMEFFKGTPLKYSEEIMLPAIEKLFSKEKELCVENIILRPQSNFRYTNLWEGIKKILYYISNKYNHAQFAVGLINDLPILQLLRQILLKSGFILILSWGDSPPYKPLNIRLGKFINQIPMIIFKESDLHSAASIAIESAFTKPPIVGQVDTIFIEESALDAFIVKLKSKLNSIQQMLVPFQKATLEKVEKEAKSLGLEIYQVPVNKSKATLIIGGKPFSNMEILDGKLYNAAVLYVIPFRTKEDVLVLLKKIPSTYGVSIWCEKVTLVNEMTEKVSVKRIWINCCGLVEYDTKNKFKRKEVEDNVEKIQEDWNNTSQAEKLKLIKEFLNANNSISYMPKLKQRLNTYLQCSTQRYSYKYGKYLITNITKGVGQVQLRFSSIQCRELFLILAALMKGNIVRLVFHSDDLSEYKRFFKIFVEKGIMEISNTFKIWHLADEDDLHDKEDYDLIKEFETLSKQIWTPIQ